MDRAEPKKTAPQGGRTVRLQSKDTKFRQEKHFRRQKARVLKSFQASPKSMLMAAIDTGVMRSNICWYIGTWRTRGVVEYIGKGICRISKREVDFYVAKEGGSL